MTRSTTDSALDRVVAALEQGGHHPRQSGGGYSSQCPAHDDRAPSLSITPANSQVLLHCHAGCATEDVLKEIRLTMADLFDEPPAKRERPQVVAEYQYTDEQHQVLFLVRRIEPGYNGERKTFRQFRPDGTPGIKGVRRVLYRLPEVIATAQAGGTVYLAEGEKDVDNLTKLGITATCNVGGAGKWADAYTTALHGASEVVIIADRDDPGRKHAAQVAQSAQNAGIPIRVVEPVEGCKDVTDHLTTGHTLDDLVDVAATDTGTTPRHLKAVPTHTTHATETDGANALDNHTTQQQPAPQPTVGFSYKVFGLPADIETPTNYRVSSKGVALKRVVGKEEDWVRFTFAPLVVTATFEDPDGEQRVELSWLDWGKGERVVSRIVSREIAKRGKELVKQLGSAGLPAVEGDARLLERWLAEFEAANRDKIPSEQLARWLGWQPDGTFVASPEDGVRVDVVYEEMRAPANAHGRHGSLDGWKTTVKGVENFPVVRAAIAAALAAALLKLLRINSFTVDISGRSTGGKTTSLQCGLSVWANPSEDSDAMSNWRTTLYAIEKRLNLVRGIVTVFDETQAVTDDTLINEVLYQLPMNHGKARAGGAHGSMLPWETILLSSGERPALSFTTHQGAAARVLCVTIPPFGTDGGEAAEAARDGVLANFGHAGPAFVAYLRDGLAKPGGLEKLRDKHRELTDRFRGDNDMTRRRAPMVAAVALAEILACRAGLLPYGPLPEEQWRRLFAAYSAADNRPEMAMDVVREYLAGHSWELYDRQRVDIRQPPVRGWLGAITHAGSETRIAVLPEKLRGVLADAGYVLDAVTDAWIDAGYLELRENQRPPHKVKVRIDGQQAKCLVFTPKALELGDTIQGAAS